MDTLVMASTLNHPSYENFSVKNDYFAYEGKGTCELKPGYLPHGNTSDDDLEE